jgi:23S rRNA (adenine2503-C2)-methyltransferase
MRTLLVRERERTLGSFDTPEARVTPGAVEKLLVELDDGSAVEAIVISTFGPRVARLLELDRRLEARTGLDALRRLPWLQPKIRYETCVSTQVGCALDCHFCASSLVPFVRNLSPAELRREIATVEAQLPPGGRLRKVVFAGVGEPLMNYEAVAETVRWLDGRGIRARVNTVGVIPALRRLFEERLPVELIVSIHAPDDALRAELMPAGKGYSLAEVRSVLRTAPRDMLIECKYLMLRGVNDALEQAERLADWVDDLPVLVTLQMYNRIEERDYRPSEPERVRDFAARLRARGLRVSMLNSNIGEPVSGGCGQLRARVAGGHARLPIVEA